MPFISRGVTVGFVRADEKSSLEVLKELMEKSFTGRVELDVVCGDERLVGAIELLKGRIVAAELELPRRLYAIDALIVVVNKWLRNCRGYAEIIELDEEKVNLDLEDNPRAKLDPEEASKVIASAEAVYRETVPSPGVSKPAEEEAPTAPIPTVPLPRHEERVEEKGEEKIEVVTAPPEQAPSAAGLGGVEVVASSESILERLDSPLFDATVVLKGSLVESSAIEPRELPRLIERLVEVSKQHPDRTVVAFINDRLNEIRAKLVAHDGVLVATLVRRNSERLVDEEGLKALAGFERGLLYSIYLIDPSVDETLHRLAQEAVRKAREEEARAKTSAAGTSGEQAREVREEVQPAEEARLEEAETGRKRRRFLFFLRRK